MCDCCDCRRIPEIDLLGRRHETIRGFVAAAQTVNDEPLGSVLAL